MTPAMREARLADCTDINTSGQESAAGPGPRNKLVSLVKKYGEFGYPQPELQSSALQLAGRAPLSLLEPSSCLNPIGNGHLDTFPEQDQQPSFFLVTFISQLSPTAPVFSSLLGIFNPHLTGESPLQSLFWGWRGEGRCPLCFFHHLTFWRYKKVRCLRLERSEHKCPQQLCNPKNGNLEILTARACFKDFKQPRDKKAHQSTPAGSVLQYISAWYLALVNTKAKCTGCTSPRQPHPIHSCCPRSDGTYLDGMKCLHVTEQTLSQLLYI